MIRLAGFLIGLGLMASPGLACRQALALGVDISGSVDAQEYDLQMRGLANALRNPDVIDAFTSMPHHPVRLMVFLWSAPDQQVKALNWSAITDAAALHTAAQQIERTPRPAGDPSTGLGAAMMFGVTELSTQVGCWQLTLDISGDGKSNTNPAPHTAQVYARRQNVTINGLVIGSDDPSMGDQRAVQIGELSAYYRSTVIAGPGAFVETALGFEDFEQAMTRKLLREVSALRLGDVALPR